MPGTASHVARAAAPGIEPIRPNLDGGSIIANNIISHFGYGHAHWVWKNRGSPILLDSGQKPENPPLTDVVVQGNIVYNTGRDQPGTTRGIPGEGPRYQYAVRVADEAQNIHFADNILAPGTKVRVEDLPPLVTKVKENSVTPEAEQILSEWPPLPETGLPLIEVEKSIIRRVLKLKAGNITQAANYLSVPRHILAYRMEKYGISK